MPAVFVHGNPETPAVWGPLLEQLERSDVLTPRLPGFGVAAPDGFGATKEEYVDWLVGELVAIGEPVDLVGHDWGGGFVARVACLRPDLLRSWATDVTGLLHPDYVWHDFAQIWQTPGAGEQYFTDMMAAPRESVVEILMSIGITPAEVAGDFADALDDEMARCVLALYRSATQPELGEWRRDLEAASARPGLAIVNTEDPYIGDPERSAEVGRRMGATVELQQGSGHWWMLQDPAAGTAILERFWASI